MLQHPCPSPLTRRALQDRVGGPRPGPGFTAPTPGPTGLSAQLTVSGVANNALTQPNQQITVNWKLSFPAQAATPRAAPGTLRIDLFFSPASATWNTSETLLRKPIDDPLKGSGSVP